MKEPAEWLAVSLIPQAVEVIVGQSVSGRIVIAIDRLDGDVRMFNPDCRGGGLEKPLQFRAVDVAVADGAPLGREGLVDIRQQHDRRVGAHMPRHFPGLTHGLAELRSAQESK